MTWSTVSIVQKSVSLLFVLGILSGFYFYSKQVPGGAPSRQTSVNSELNLIDPASRPPFKLNQAPPKKGKPKPLQLKKYYVHIWAITCEPCIEEIPWLANFTARPVHEGAKDLWIHVAENNDETVRAKRFLAEQTFNKDILFVNREDFKEMNLAGYPTHYLIDGQNRVAFEWTGRLEKIEPEFRKLWLQLQSEL